MLDGVLLDFTYSQLRFVNAAIIAHPSLIFCSNNYGIINMFEADFLSPYAIDESKIVKIQLSQFFINVGLDVGIFIFSFLVWKYVLWVPI